MGICSAFDALIVKCDVIKQNESEVGINMLLVSEVIFHLNLYNINIKTRHLSQVHDWSYIYLNKYIM